MHITEIAFVAYPVTDIDRARAFYEDVLGLAIGEIAEEIDGVAGKHWIEYEIGEGTFAISNMWEPDGKSGPTIAFEVEDFDRSIAQLKGAGANIVAERIDSPVCKFALITDPDGNGITIHKRND